MSVAAAGLMGCDVYVGHRSHEQAAYVQQQPTYVQQQPYYADQQPQYVEVQEAPPPLIVERRPAPPSTAHIWIDGYWNWDSRQYRWEGGHYARPPEANMVWIAPRYEREGHGYRYTAGQWRRQQQDNGRGRGDRRD